VGIELVDDPINRPKALGKVDVEGAVDA